MKKTLIVLLLIFFTTAVSGFAKIISISNQYIKVSLDDDSGRFLLSTLKGDPDNKADDNKDLLLYKLPPTSVTTISIDGETVIFGSSVGNYKNRGEVVGNKIMTEWTVKGVNIIQELSIVKGQSTGREDSMRIYYRVRNENNRIVKIGLRILLDTSLGDRPGIAFRMSEGGDIDKDTQFFRNEIPTFWYNFDSFSNPQVRSQGILVALGVTKPDKVIFSSWDRLYDNPWDYVIDSTKELKKIGTSTYDSAVALYYDPMELNFNQSMYIISQYGLYGVSTFSSKDLNLTLSVPAENKNPPRIRAEIKNIGATPIDKLTLKIEYPKEFTLAADKTNVVEFVKMNPQETKVGLWDLNCKTITGSFEVKVTATGTIGTTSQKVSASKTFTIDYKEDLMVRDDTISRDLDSQVSNKILGITNTNTTKTTKKNPRDDTKDTTVKDTGKPSKEELEIQYDIDLLDALTEEVDKKYDMLYEMYQNKYLNKDTIAAVDEYIYSFEVQMKDAETSLSNLRSRITDLEKKAADTKDDKKTDTKSDTKADTKDDKKTDTKSDKKDDTKADTKADKKDDKKENKTGN